MDVSYPTAPFESWQCWAVLDLGPSVKETTLRWVEQVGGQWWCSLWWQLVLFGSIRLGRFLLQVFKNLLNDLGVLNAGNDFDLTAAVFTDLDVDVEHSFEALHDFHGWNECRLCMEQKPVQVIARWRSAGLLSSQSTSDDCNLSDFLPRLAGVTSTRCLLLGANTP